jgi:hypothetical protein
MVGGSCSPNPCPTPGACCRGSFCLRLPAEACGGSGSRFAGVGVACNAAGNNLTPCCKADFNQDGMLTTSDVFTCLNAWFMGDYRTDFNADGFTTTADVFGFLNAWFAGCH